MSHSGPLHGLRILDLTAIVMGPYATQTLADLGAEVIKVEPPGGDGLRAIGPMRNAGMGAMSLHLNRNKRSLVLDLKQPEGRDACLRLAQGCDALVYSTRPQALARLGLGFEAVAALNPRIVHVGCYGYGEQGPYAGRPAYDDLIQGAAGLPLLASRQGAEQPAYVPLTLADRSVGLQAALALLAAVMHARTTGQGQAVEVTMFESLAQWVMGDHLGGSSFEPALGPMGYARLLSPHRRPYATADGHLAVLIYNDKHWRAFLSLIGRAELMQTAAYRSQGARAEHIDAVYAHVAEVMRMRSTAQWLEVLTQADIPAAPLHTLESLRDDPHLHAVGFFAEMEHPSEGRIRTVAPLGRYSATPPGIRRPAPRLGQHSRELLREAGYEDTHIEHLLAHGISAQAGEPGDTA